MLIRRHPARWPGVRRPPFWQAGDIARSARFVTADFLTNSGGPLTALGVAGIVDALYARLQR